MSILRQLPELCIRGSVANITMANLTKEQQDRVDKITRRIAAHPDMQGKRHAFARELAATIGADYKSDWLIADEEYYIAIWRGVVGILYHKKYSFVCRACGSSHWITERGIPRPIDKQRIPCPNCKMMCVETAGDTNLSPGSFITKEDYDVICSNTPYKEHGEYGWVSQDLPTCSSTIDYVEGVEAYSDRDPEAILNNDKQLIRFFGEYMWNYFRQHLAENRRKEHKQKKVTVTGPADEIIFNELVALCKRMHIEHDADRYRHDAVSFIVRLHGRLVPPEFIAELCMLRERALRFSITIVCSDECVRVLKNADAPAMQTTVSLSERVIFQEDGSKDDARKVFSINDMYNRTVEGTNMDQDDHIQQIESADVLAAVRAALPDGDCKIVFDIYSQQGPAYTEFSDIYGTKEAKKSHIAKHLGTTSHQVGVYFDMIKVNMLVHSVVPG